MLNLYNTLTRKKEEFIPLKKGKVGMYSCGPTVYAFASIGNFRAYIFSDILKRVLLYNKYKVKHIMNITDVGHLTSDSDEGEDKILKAANKAGKSAYDIARFYEEKFKEDAKALNILEPDKYVRATDHIKEQIELVKRLEELGFTYKTSDGIYFDTSKFKDYGKLAHLDIENLQKGSRVDFKEKKNITDFALWKFSPKEIKREMEWDSPWGVGFPGWHIECSAMAMRYLGETFDIHTGGIDHIPVHHTNEICQSEAATGKKFVNYWLHSEFLQIDGGKMSKSLGNIYTVDDLKAKGFSAVEYRYLNLLNHYQSKLNFTWESLENNGKKGLESLIHKILLLKNKIGKNAETDNLVFAQTANFLLEFETAINDDLNTPIALGKLFETLKNINEISGPISKTAYKNILKTIEKADFIFGLNLSDLLEEKENVKIPQAVLDLVAEREVARGEKDFAKSDELREKIKVLGFEVEDGKDGAAVRKI